MIRSSRSGRLMLALALSLGCASDAPPSSRDVAVRDSAGIRIVENVDVAGRTSGWSVDPEPILRVGWAEGDPQLQFVRSGFVGGDRVVFGDMLSQTVYIYATSGEPVSTLGGKGEGPGEFGRLERILQVSPDSFLVSDSGNLRVTFFAGTDLAYDRRFEGYVGDAGYAPRARAPDGSYLLTPTMFTIREVRSDERWAFYPILRTADFTRLDTIAILPMLEMRDMGDRNPNMRFGTAVPAADGLAAATNDVAEVRWLGPDGDVRQIARWDAVARPVTDADRDTWEQTARSRLTTAPSAQIEDMMRQSLDAFAGTVPLFGAVHGDSEGNVWLGEHDWAPEAGDTYNVVAATGEWLGSVVFPRGIRILDITSDRVLGVETDDLDVQSVVLYALVKPE